MKYRSKKPIATRKRLKRRTTRIPRSVPMRTGNMISVKRKCYAGVLTPNTTTVNGFWNYMAPSLNNVGSNFNGGTLGGLTNLLEYTALFETFKLSAIKYEFRPRVSDLQSLQSNPSTGTTFTDIPYVSFIYDPKSQVVPSGTYSSTTYNAFAENGNVITRRGDKPIKIYLKPLVSEQYGGGANRYVKPYQTDLASGTGMQHRGFHLFFHNYAFTNVFTAYDVYVTYYLNFRGMK